MYGGRGRGRRQNAHDARSADRLHTQRRGVGRVTRSHGVRCVKWSTISPLPFPPPHGNYMYPIPASPSRLSRGRTGAACGASSTSSASMAHGVSARHNRRLLLSPDPARTHARERRLRRWCDDPRMRRVREHRPPIDCIIIIPLLLSRARYPRCPARTTEPSFRSTIAAVRIAITSSIFAIDPSARARIRRRRDF